MAVIPFVDMSASPLSAACAHGITDELIHILMRTDGCRVIAASSMMQLGSLANDIPALADKLGVQFVFEGTVREEGNHLRVTARLVNADGFQLWSQRFEAEPDASNLFRIEEQIASALVSRVAPRQSVVRKLQASAAPSLLKLYPAILAAEEMLEDGNAADLHAGTRSISKCGSVRAEVCARSLRHCPMLLWDGSAERTQFSPACCPGQEGLAARTGAGSRDDRSSFGHGLRFGNGMELDGSRKELQASLTAGLAPWDVSSIFSFPVCSGKV